MYSTLRYPLPGMCFKVLNPCEHKHTAHTAHSDTRIQDSIGLFANDGTCRSHSDRQSSADNPPRLCEVTQRLAALEVHACKIIISSFCVFARLC